MLVNSLNLIFELERCADFAISAFWRVFYSPERSALGDIGFVPPVLSWYPPTAVTNEMQYRVLCGNGF